MCWAIHAKGLTFVGQIPSGKTSQLARNNKSWPDVYRNNQKKFLSDAKTPRPHLMCSEDRSGKLREFSARWARPPLEKLENAWNPGRVTPGWGTCSLSLCSSELVK
jgi:hypothetical protein